jgi:hypothetical protein
MEEKIPWNFCALLWVLFLFVAIPLHKSANASVIQNYYVQSMEINWKLQYFVRPKTLELTLIIIFVNLIFVFRNSYIFF